MALLSNDLRAFIHLLNTKSVKYVIVGAWALAFHGRPRYTGDIDLFVARDPDNADRLKEVIEDFGFGQTGIERDDFLHIDHVIHISDVPVFVISRDLLIKNKRAANRDKDQGDVKLLEKTRPPRR
jgi:Nucleotidyltransferase of unknown function (DUF6036)